jgi:hypothetical protein
MEAVLAIRHGIKKAAALRRQLVLLRVTDGLTVGRRSLADLSTNRRAGASVQLRADTSTYEAPRETMRRDGACASFGYLRLSAPDK